MLTVIKAEIITRENINSEQPYVFPDSSDDITSFSGRSGQVLLPNMLLKDVLNKLQQGTYTMY